MKECLDTSVIVKWFKKNESREEEALAIREKLNTMESEIIINEWVLLELVRALVKSDYSCPKIENAIDYMNGVIDIGAIRTVKVSEVIDLAQKYQIEFSLYAADAVHLATAIHTSSDVFWTEDKHFMKEKIIRMADTFLLKIKQLKDY
ncbi:MAG: type II toxin-antitoxin system VapC family toxin [Candidatus Thermoplasmatota archaeon]|nr:type II toxin-antitoxin system VapC family toxin [Candidatus Thermoplasmatota archaeon]